MKILMKTLFWGTVVILGLMLNPQASAADKKLKPHAISGNWIGYYDYDGNTSQPEVAFSMLVKQPSSSEFGIAFLEPNTSSGAKYFARLATVHNATIHNSRTISFTKQYQDGATPIRYKLSLFNNNSVMYGTWRIGKSASGTAFFVKTSLKDIKALRESFQ